MAHPPPMSQPQLQRPVVIPDSRAAHQSVGPYLSAALSVLQTLERELRAAAAPGSREELSADALALRATELQTQITRLEVEARSSQLESQLDSALGRPSSGHMALNKQGTGRVRTVTPAASGMLIELQGKLALAERDAKAYKSRLRHQDESVKHLKELTAREAELEKQLLSAQGTAATRVREAEELRGKLSVEKATSEALRKELERAHGRASKGGGGHEPELLAQVGELQRKVQAVTLESATWERKAEVLEAELVAKWAEVYALQGQAGTGGHARPLSEEEESQLGRCMRHALETASDAEQEVAARDGSWSATRWLDTLGLGEAVGGALFHRLRGGAPAERQWLERPFVSSLAGRGGYSLIKAMLLETSIIDELSTRLWRGMVEVAAGSDAGDGAMTAGAASVFAAPPEGSATDGNKGWHLGDMAISAALAPTNPFPPSSAHPPGGAMGFELLDHSYQQQPPPSAGREPSSSLRAQRDAEENASALRHQNRNVGLHPLPSSCHPTAAYEPSSLRDAAGVALPPLAGAPLVQADAELGGFLSLADEPRKGARRELEFATVGQLPPDLQQSRVPTYAQRAPGALQTPGLEEYSDVSPPVAVRRT